MRTISEVELLKEFGDNLRDILIEYQMTQAELAEETGMSEATISRYIKGERMPTLRSLVNLIYVLECDPDELIDFDYFVE
jgi:transcriptional regulator with XRE-family HTH domain